MLLGKKIKFIRNQNGIKQKALCEKIGCSIRSMSGYENDSHQISHEFIEKISWEFDIDSRFFNSYKEFDNIEKLAICNTRATEEFPKTVVGILEIMSKRMLNNQKKILCLNLGTVRFNEIEKLIGSWDSIKRITIADVELEIFVKGNIEIVSFESIESFYMQEPDRYFIEEKLLRILIKNESNYGMIIGFNELITNFTKLIMKPKVFNAHLLDNYLSKCNTILIPINGLYSIKQLNYFLEKFSKNQNNEAQIFILKNEYKISDSELRKKIESIEEFDKKTDDLEYWKDIEWEKFEMDNYIKSIMENNNNLNIKYLNTIIPTWENTLEGISYFQCNSIGNLKNAFLDACSEMKLI